MTRYEKTARQVKLEELALSAWPGQSLEVVSVDEGYLHVWDEQGKTLLSVRHPLAEEALAVFARELGAMSIGAAIDAVEMILRERMSRHGVDIAGIRAGKIIFWDDEGQQAATGGSLREAIANLDKRRRQDGVPPSSWQVDAPPAPALDVSVTAVLPAAAGSTKP